MNAEDKEEWNDYSNSLMLYEQIEKLHNEYNREIKILKDCNNKELSNCDVLFYGENKNAQVIKSRDIIKPSMYNYDVINYYKDEVTLKKKIMELSEDIMTAIYHIYDSLRLCKENVFLSFNGGKDAVVVLHLFRCAYARYLYDVKGERKKPKLIYFKDDISEFPEVYHFLNECVYMYDFNISVIKGTWRSSITNFVENYQKQYQIVMTDQMKVSPNDSCPFFPIITFINGTRYNDTYSEKLQILNISSREFPPYLYLNPIFYWTYGAIWTFILYFKFDYCILYDHGYSSIGSLNDTIKNEFLKCNDCYLPAYFLKNWGYERHNRVLNEEKKVRDS
ncbi:FAD synthetase [Plasmodium brasilianum]|uniref:FAD synthase n=2 Tax=Plasmodium (Plasmodium) TaxID=418103 RepID=A0A1A8VVC9_PLAMA|nr:FAD synthetase, putative [Plasmodium malariae]KAI4838844.1 FAD synthetase [Plasmodium brasilianum]SBS84515.1 FAD synthetase, putative [Plasmodium malariae]SCN12185.1 FAD synthetase, putative [Plasmodium malariae]